MKPSADQTIERTKMPRFMMEGPRPGKIFCFELCMNCVTNTFLLVSSSVRSKPLLCFVHGQSQKGEQKHATNIFVRGGSRTFLRRGAPLRNDVTDGEVKKKLKANTYIRRRKLHLKGPGGAHRLHPPPRSAPVCRVS